MLEIQGTNASFSLFDDPTGEGRRLYTKYWQEKLSDNDDIDFPDSLATEIVDSTSGFSFAYLKEALCVRFLSPQPNY